jgi:recombination associated protein RdgC
MWFKNLQIYQINADANITLDQLEQAMPNNAFKPCKEMDLQSIGWDMPLGKKSESLVHETNGFVMICQKTQEKLLPASVINELLAEKLEEIEQQEGRKPAKKEKDQLKDELILTLVPRAFSRSRRLFAYFDLKQNYFIVDSTSAKKAEDLISLVRESLGSFPVKPLAVKKPIGLILTSWIQSQAPEGIEIGNEAELKDTGEEGGVVKAKGVDLTDSEIQNHIENGKNVSQLALEWKERINCLISDDLVIKRVKFTDMVQEEDSGVVHEDFASQFDADFAIMSGEFSQFIPWLVEEFGGLAD